MAAVLALLVSCLGLAANGSAANPPTASMHVELTEAERAYLAQKGTLKMCVQPDGFAVAFVEVLYAKEFGCAHARVLQNTTK